MATRVTLSYAPTGEETAAALDSGRYQSYLRRAHAGSVNVGDVWDEFVSWGCGTTRDVTLRVESTAGGEVVGEATEFEFEPHDV